MKTLFFLVVIANVAFFMWEYKTGAFVPVSETSEQNTDSDQEQILLVSELKHTPQIIAPAPVLEPPPAEHTVTGQAVGMAPITSVSTSIDKPALEKPAAVDLNVTNPGKNAEGCYEVGPFANQNVYRIWANRFKDLTSEIQSINRDDQIPSNYMVYYPAAANELESEANIKMLKDHGIKDLWLLTGEDKGKISLGLFIKEESALVMKNELLAKGINAEVKAKYKIKSQKYALIKSNDKLMERLDELKKIYPELKVKQVQDLTTDCAHKIINQVPGSAGIFH